MSAVARVRCAGAPRDLGLDQGEAARAEVRAAVAGRRRDDTARRAARDAGRFFPHHAERLQGLALGARVPERAVEARLAEWLAGDAGVAVALAGDGAAWLARSVALPAPALLLRESAPDNDYRSLELAPAWSVAAFLGVNEHGLAATATALAAAAPSLEGCAAPAQLLVQDVLQRFDVVEKAVEWALRRPAGGCASLLLADASGARAAVEIQGRERRVQGAGAAARLGFGPAAATAALEKRLAEQRPRDPQALARALGEAAAPSAVVAVADPAGRRLGVAAGGAPLAWHGLALR